MPLFWWPEFSETVETNRNFGTSPACHFISKVFLSQTEKSPKTKAPGSDPFQLAPAVSVYVYHSCIYIYMFIFVHIQSILMYIYIYISWLSWKGISKIPPSHARIWASVRCRCSIEGSHVKVEGQIRRLTFIKRRGWAFQTAKWEASLLGQLREAPARMRLGAKACKWSGGANFAWCGVMWFQGVDLE